MAERDGGMENQWKVGETVKENFFEEHANFKD
jgi:hypothetical protein